MKVCLILCDSLRYDRVNSHIMPYLTQIASKGHSFTHYYADGGTTKWSMPFYLSGQRAFDPENSFPNKLTRNKTHNTMIHSNAVLVKEKYQNCFMKHKDVGVEMAPVQQTARNMLRNSEIWKKTRKLRKAIQGEIKIPYRRAENIFKTAQPELTENSDGFFWIHLMDPHIPYLPPGLDLPEKRKATTLYEKILKNDTITPEETEALQNLYDQECRYMDTEISKFIAFNPETVFFVTSDHGEMFGETGSYSHGPYYHGLTPQLSHVPLIIYGEDVRKNVNRLYHSSIEVGSTILDLFNIQTQNGYGKSFKKEIMK